MSKRRRVIICLVAAAVVLDCGAEIRPYRLEIVAQTDSQFTGFEASCSINDVGQVGFVGQTNNSTISYESVFRGDVTNVPINLSPGFATSTRDFNFSVQIDNAGNVVARDRVSGVPPSYLVRSWNGGFTTVARSGVSPTFYDSVNLPMMNNNGQVEYVALESGSSVTSVKLNTAGTDVNIASYTGAVAMRPMVDDLGNVVFRDPNNRIVVWNSSGTTVTIIASTNNLFTSLGSSPGISDNGNVVGFYGADGQGIGIFASISNGGSRILKRIVGVADGFTSFVTDSRIGVRDSQNYPRSATLVYLGTRSGKLGLYSTLVTYPLTPSGGFEIGPTRSIVETGDAVFEDRNDDGLLSIGERSIAGQVQSIAVYDPINRSGQIAFWMQSDSGAQAIIRANPCRTVQYTGYKQCGATPAVPATFGLNAASTCSYGCALTSASAMFSSVGGLETSTPATLNTTLTNISGFQPNSALLKFPKLGDASAGKLKYAGSLPISGSLNDNLEYYFCHRGDRVILNLRHEKTKGSLPTQIGNHFVFLTGKTNDDWTVFDPGWSTVSPQSNLLTLSGHTNGFTTTKNGVDTFHKFSVAEVRPFRTVANVASIVIEAHSPVELLAIDPSGRRVGFDSVANQDVVEIPGSGYLRDFPILDEEGDADPIGDQDAIKTLFLPAPVSGNYALIITATTNGSYTIENSKTAFDGSTQTSSFIGTAVTGAKTTNTFQVPILPPVCSITNLNGNVLVSFSAQAGQLYTLECKNALSDTNWSVVGVYSNFVSSVTIGTNATQTANFYRVKVQ